MDEPEIIVDGELLVSTRSRYLCWYHDGNAFIRFGITPDAEDIIAPIPVCTGDWRATAILAILAWEAATIPNARVSGPELTDTLNAVIRLYPHGIYDTYFDHQWYVTASSPAYEA